MYVQGVFVSRPYPDSKISIESQLNHTMNMRASFSNIEPLNYVMVKYSLFSLRIWLLSKICIELKAIMFVG